MRTPMRAALRLALAGCLGLAGLFVAAAEVRAAAPPENTLPDSTFVFLKVKNAEGIRTAFRQSQLGQLWADPALKPFKDDLVEKLDEGNKTLKERLGVTFGDLLEMPQGTCSIAVTAKEDAENPVALLVTLDAGKNAGSLADVIGRIVKQGEESGAKVAKEEFKGLSIQTVTPPKAKDKDKDDDKAGDRSPPPLSWTRDGSVFTFGTDLESVKDLVAHASGRENSLAANENFASSVKKLGSESHILWYIDLNKVLKLVPKLGARGNNPDAFQQFETFSQVLGINGLKAAAGTYSLNSGDFDTVSKIYVLAPQPLVGLLKLFPMPKVNLRPEPWVPASVASYQTFSWDLDTAFTNLNDLANMFQPGALNALEQQIVGPNGGEPINFKKDIFDPLGDRITIISDFKKPITEDSQRALVGVALEDAEGFQATLTKLINLAGASPKKRDFQGTTIYDFDIPEIPNNPQLKGPIGVAIAKNTLFVAMEPTLLEQVLRGGSQSLAESAQFQTVAKELPDRSSTLSYTRPDESARASYEMIKSGQFEKALQGAAAGGGPDLSQITKFINKDKLPEFSVFAKYLSQGGGYTTMDDDGVTFTNFTLRKTNP